MPPARLCTVPVLKLMLPQGLHGAWGASSGRGDTKAVRGGGPRGTAARCRASLGQQGRGCLSPVAAGWRTPASATSSPGVSDLWALRGVGRSTEGTPSPCLREHSAGQPSGGELAAQAGATRHALRGPCWLRGDVARAHGLCQPAPCHCAVVTRPLPSHLRGATAVLSARPCQLPAGPAVQGSALQLGSRSRLCSQPPTQARDPQLFLPSDS